VGDGAAHCKVYREFVELASERAEPIELSFGVWTLQESDHVLEEC